MWPNHTCVQSKVTWVLLCVHMCVHVCERWRYQTSRSASDPRSDTIKKKKARPAEQLLLKHSGVSEMGFLLLVPPLTRTGLTGPSAPCWASSRASFCLWTWFLSLFLPPFFPHQRLKWGQILSGAHAHVPDIKLLMKYLAELEAPKPQSPWKLSWWVLVSRLWRRSASPLWNRSTRSRVGLQPRQRSPHRPVKVVEHFQIGSPGGGWTVPESPVKLCGGLLAGAALTCVGGGDLHQSYISAY